MSTWTNGKIKQYLVATMASTGGFVIGILIGWTNIMQLNVMTGQMGQLVVESQYSWMASLLLLAAAISTIPTGFVMDIIGRRMTMLLLAIPITIGWLILVLSSGFVLKCLARFMQGISVGALSASVPLYVHEICEQKYHHTLFPIYFIMINCGIFMVFIFGVGLNALNVTWLCTIFAVLFVIGFMTVPESPVHLVNKEKIPDAIKALKQLRSPGHDIDAEIKSINAAHVQRQKVYETFNIEVQQSRTLKPLIVMILIIVFQQFSGIYVIIFYSSYLFLAANITSMFPQAATTLVGLAMFSGSLFSLCMIDRFRRRTLLIVSTVTIALSTLFLAFYYFRLSGNPANSNDWLPMLCMCAFTVMYALANGPVTWLVVNEIFQPDVKYLIVSILTTLEWFIAFVVTKSFTKIEADVGLGPTFTIYTIFAALCLIVIGFFLIETKDKTIEEIQAKLNRPPPMPTVTSATTTPPSK